MDADHNIALAFGDSKMPCIYAMMSVVGFGTFTVRMTKAVTTLIQIWYWTFNMSDASHP